jgi:radical SAM-linked protein
MSKSERKSAVARVRITYSKLGEARFVGTRELATLFTRAVRRAHLPVAYSQGFHPLPRLSFGPALPLGVESEEEFLDIELSEPLAAAEVGQRLGAELPRGFTVYRAETIDLKAPSIDASIRGMQYVVGLDTLPSEKRTPAFLAERLGTFHASPTFPLRKYVHGKEKTVDAKRFVAGITLIAPHALSIETVVTNTGTIKPQEFVGTLLGLTPEESKILRLTKTQTFFASHAESSMNTRDLACAEGFDSPLPAAGAD